MPTYNLINVNIATQCNGGDFETERSTWGISPTGSSLERDSTFKFHGIYSGKVTTFGAIYSKTAINPPSGETSPWWVRKSNTLNFTIPLKKDNKYIAMLRVRVPTPFGDQAFGIKTAEYSIFLKEPGSSSKISEIKIRDTEATANFIKVEVQFVATATTNNALVGLDLEYKDASSTNEDGLKNRIFYIDTLRIEEYQYVPDLEELNASFTKKDVTVFGGNDGQINIHTSGGSGNFLYLWADLPFGPDNLSLRTGLLAGLYAVTVYDNTTNLSKSLNIEIKQPGFVKPEGNGFFSISPANSLQFSPVQTIDNCNNPYNLDNRLFNEHSEAGIKRACYYQQYQTCDKVKTQFKSDFSSHTVNILNLRTGSTTLLTVNKALELTGHSKEYTGFLKSNGDGKTRVYFNTPFLPFIFKEGQSIEVYNSNILNGTYTILSINFDVLGTGYLLINAAYDSQNLTESAGIRAFYNEFDFDVYEFEINFAGYQEGLYQVVINFSTSTVKSEVISIGDYPNSLVIKYRNLDNAFGIEYITGITGLIRINARFRERNPFSDIKNYTDNFKLKKVKAEIFRRIKLEIREIPPWMVEKLAIVFLHDYFEVNGVEYQSNSGLEPTYQDRYALASAEIELQQVEWLDGYNGDDFGNIDFDNDTGFIIGNNGLIKR